MEKNFTGGSIFKNLAFFHCRICCLIFFRPFTVWQTFLL